MVDSENLYCHSVGMISDTGCTSSLPEVRFSEFVPASPCFVGNLARICREMVKETEPLCPLSVGNFRNFHDYSLHLSVKIKKLVKKLQISRVHREKIGGHGCAPRNDTKNTGSGDEKGGGSVRPRPPVHYVIALDG